MSKIKAVTHNGSFHADDVFAFATLLLALGPNVELTRSRDPEIIKAADIVFDVGREYDPAQKRFDHHQEGGAGKRANGIPYASFGLIWKEYGEKICREEECQLIDEKLVQVIDATDNGFELFKALVENVQGYSIASVIGSLNRTSLENDKSDDDQFKKGVEVAKLVLYRELAAAKEYSAANSILERAYKDAADKRLLIIDEDLKKDATSRAMVKYPETLYVVKPYGENWSIRAMLKSINSFETRKPLPAEWAGKSPEELQKITGIKDVIFCHNGRFIASTKSKEGAVALAKLVL